VGPVWSSDGTRLVYFINGDGDPLLLADGTGDNAHPIAIVPSDPRDWAKDADQPVHNHNPVWSTDDQWIYFVHGQVHALDWTDRMDVWRVRPDGGAPERLTHQGTAVTFLAPIDTRTLLYVARAEDGSGPWLWELDVVDKSSRRVISGLEQYTSIAASHDGRRLVATVARPTGSLWTVPILDRQAEERDVQPYPVQTLRALAPRFGGASLFFLSARGTGDGLWRFQNGQAVEVWKGQAGALSDPPAVSRDGRRVIVMPRRDEKQHLTIMSAEGTDATALAPSIETLGTADWSLDAKSVVTGGRDADGPALFLIPVDGGAPRRLVAGEAVNPIWSPDGSWIVYSGPLVAGAVPLVGVRPDGTPVPLPPLKVRPGSYRFLPSGAGLVYLAFGSLRGFSLLDLRTNASRQLTVLDNLGTLRGFDITADGKHIVFDRSRQNSDIVLIELPRK
jgi:Tol biopolymer transport system component